MFDLDPIYVASLAYVLLFLSAALGMALHRSSLVLTGKREANSFRPSGENMSPFGTRLVRVHANMYENLGVFAVLLLIAVAMGRVELLNGFAYVFLAGRAAQCAIHLISTSEVAVVLRAGAFFLQKAIEVYWVVLLVLHGPASGA